MKIANPVIVHVKINWMDITALILSITDLLWQFTTYLHERKEKKNKYKKNNN